MKRGSALSGSICRSQGVLTCVRQPLYFTCTLSIIQCAPVISFSTLSTCQNASASRMYFSQFPARYRYRAENCSFGTIVRKIVHSEQTSCPFMHCSSLHEDEDVSSSSSRKHVPDLPLVVSEPLVSDPLVAGLLVSEPVSLVSGRIVFEPLVAEVLVTGPLVSEPLVDEPLVSETVQGGSKREQGRASSRTPVVQHASEPRKSSLPGSNVPQPSPGHGKQVWDPRRGGWASVAATKSASWVHSGEHQNISQ